MAVRLPICLHITTNLYTFLCVYTQINKWVYIHTYIHTYIHSSSSSESLESGGRAPSTNEFQACT